MPERTVYANGTPSWVDVSTPDLPATIAFYGEIFGWEAAEAGPAEQTGGYTMFFQDGKPVAGAMTIQAEGQPVVWSTYIAVDDADKAHQLALDAGGLSIAPPMDVMTAGRMAFLADLEGAVFGIWQAGDHAGSAIVNEPVSLCWNELASRDPESAKRFYGTLFGWSAQTADAGGQEYTTFMLGDAPVAGLFTPTPEMGPVPAHWGVVFAVTDPDAIAAKVPELGGQVVFPPMDIPVGRVAYVTDQHGAPFQVIRLAETPA